MKKKRILLVGIAALLLYPCSYVALRLTKYFVRQQFVTFGCSESIREKHPDDSGPVQDGYTSYSFESDRNQIGCGRIQKDSARFGEPVLLPIFTPLGEMEMSLRGFTDSKLQVLKSVAEFERYDSESNKVYYHRQSLLDEITVARKDQTF
jgi:hypothetical protein